MRRSSSPPQLLLSLLFVVVVLIILVGHHPSNGFNINNNNNEILTTTMQKMPISSISSSTSSLSSSSLSLLSSKTTTQTKTRTTTGSSSSSSSSSSSLSFFQLYYRNLPSLDDDDDDDVVDDDDVETADNEKKKKEKKTTTTMSNNNIDNDNYNWSLEDDWILMDTISKYTIIVILSGDEIGDGQHSFSSSSTTTCGAVVVTFWEQLLAATPKLSSKYSIKQIMDRLDVLQQKQQQQKSSPDDNKKKMKMKKSLLYGPSPPLLNHWMVNDSKQQQLSGQTDDGRWIWLQPHIIGRLADDPISTSSSFDNELVCNGMAGGYVETIGGRIYELGTPSRKMATAATAVPRSSPTKPVVASSSSSLLEDDGSLSSNDNLSLTSWWIPATTATISALVASCVLSACIGYGAGLSIIQDDHTSNMSSMNSSNGANHLQPPATVLQNNNKAPGPIAASAYAAATSQNIELSPQQQKDRLEKRIYNEQRMINMIQQKMVSDSNELRNLY